MRASAITCIAQFICLSPPRLSRCRCCFPLEASTGLVPARAAKDASLAIRFGSPLETSSCVGADGSDAGLAEQSRGKLGNTRGEGAPELADLLGAVLDSPAKSAQDSGG